MIEVSQAFKDAVKDTTKTIHAYITDGVEQINADDDLQSLKITMQTSLCRTVMRQATAVHFASHNWLDQYVNLGYGVTLPEIIDKGAFTVTIAEPAVITLTAHGLVTGEKVKISTTGNLPTGLEEGFYYVINIIDVVEEEDVVNVNTFNLALSYEDALNGIAIETTGSQDGTHSLDYYPAGGLGDDEFIDYGSFKVVEQESNEGTEGVTIKMFDKMYESLQKYDLHETELIEYPVVYPITLIAFLELICERLNWTLATSSFPNDDLEISEELFSNQQLSYRQILDYIAEASASMIYFNNDDELVVRPITSDDEVLETLDSSTLNGLKVKTKWGVLNSLVLSRMPQEDNIVEKDDTSIGLNGLTELKFANNQILDSDRETFITPIYNSLLDLDFYPFEAETGGLGYFEAGDRIIVKDPSDNAFETLVLHFEINITGGVTELIKSDTPDKTNTPYQYAGVIGQRITNTEIIVDRQNGIITLLNSDVNEIESLVTALIQTTEDIQLGISRIGGTNLLKNSTGLKGTLEEWQYLDGDGDLIDARNNGTILQTSDVRNNSESGSAIRIENQFIAQQVSTIVGETYTFYCRFNKINDCDLTITGFATEEITVPSYTDGTWAVFKKEFIANSAITEIKIENGASDIMILSDMVLKLGDVNGWIQAPNETYGANFTFDKDGFEVISLTDTFKAVLDSSSLSIIDTSSDKIMMQVSKDSGKITNLIAQQQFSIQRYENNAKSAKFLPTATGLMLIINN